MLLAELAKGRDNNFNLIRFIAASLVLFSHSYPLTMGNGYPEPLSQSLGTTWGSIAVDVFFVASGYFITASFSYKSSFKSFLMARILRIYPALIIVTILTVFVLGPVFSHIPLIDYFTSTETYRYLIKNMTLITGIEYNLPGIFENNPYKQAVNGSLWTLPYEIKMYALLVIFISLFTFIQGKLKLAWPLEKLLFLGLTTTALFLHLYDHFYETYDGQSLKLFAMFFIGSSFFFLQDKIKIVSKVGIPAIAILALSSFDKDTFFLAYTLLMPYIVFYLAYIPKGSIRKFNNFGDYSYGIYIYAFPVQQVVAATIPGISIFGMVGLSFLITLILAYLSWELIEEKALRLKTPSN